MSTETRPTTITFKVFGKVVEASKLVPINDIVMVSGDRDEAKGKSQEVSLVGSSEGDHKL